MRSYPSFWTALLAITLLLSTTVKARAADAVLAGPSSAGVSEFPAGPTADRSSGDAKWKKQWAISLAPLFASESLDAASSYGMRELNPVLASPDGGFGGKATGVKFGVIGALTGVEYILIRKYPRSAKFFSIVNWTTAGATTGLAAHNFRLPR